MGNLNCFPNENAEIASTDTVGVSADSLGDSLEKNEQDMADLDQVGSLIQNLKKKQMEHQNVLALCQELHMTNEELKAKLKNTEHQLEDKNATLEDTNKKAGTQKTDA